MRHARRLVWSPQSKRDLIAIWRYYARVASPDIADTVLRDIERAEEAIRRNPLARRVRSELGAGLRSALVSPYTIFYRVRDDDVQVVRVLHERRDFPTIFGRRQRRIE